MSSKKENSKLRQRILTSNDEEGGSGGGGGRRRELKTEYASLITDTDRKSQKRKTKQLSPSSQKQSESLSNFYLMSTIILMFFIFYLVQFMEKRLPYGLTKIDEKLPGNEHRFISEHAIEFLTNLTSVGPRVAGSYENDVWAVDYLMTRLNKISKEYNTDKRFDVEIEHQVSSGAYPLTFLDGMTLQYNDVHNVIVRVGSANANGSLMMNCHFDSVPDSPGASDDASACAVLQELFRIVLKSGQPLNYNLIFLFNGAEENIMQASHGFITQHRWAKEIKGFINLESCGAGGRELLFQAGPKNPHLLEVYSKFVPYPYASTLAQEIFQSGIIPGETDFRIFRDFGDISGVDFAWASNGYVYHTQYDHISQIPWGSLQRTGDNMLSLIRGINEEKIFHPKTGEIPGKGDELIFFDLLGAFVIRWHQSISLLINLIVAGISVGSIFKNLTSCRDEYGLSMSDYFTEICRGIGNQMLAWFVSFIIVLLIAFSLILCDRTMSWFSRPIWIYFLYVLPTLTVTMAVIQIKCERAKAQLKLKYNKKEFNSWMFFQIYFDGAQIMWTFIMVVTTAVGLRSGFISLLWVLFASINNYIHHRFVNTVRGWKWLLTHIILIGIPFLQSFYLSLGAMNMFLPIMGRTGSAFNSEIIIGVLMSSIFGVLFSFVSQLIIVAKNPQFVIRLPAGCTFLAIAIILLTNYGFPYSSDPTNLAPQRYIVSNVDKRVFDFDGKLVNHKTGYWIIDMDVNSPYSLQGAVPEIKNAKLVDTCDTEIYCGMPYYLPVLNFLWKTHWMDTPAFDVPMETTVKLNEKTFINPTTVRMNFTIDGPDHMNLMFAPKDGIELERWSIDPSKPLAGSKQFHGRNMYFIYYSYGLEKRVWNFHLDFTVPQNFDKSSPVVDLSINGHFIHGEKKQTTQLKALVDRFPDWTTTSAWTSTIRSFIF